MKNTAFNFAEHKRKERIDEYAKLAMTQILMALPHCSAEQVAQEAWGVATRMERVRSEVFTPSLTEAQYDRLQSKVKKVYGRKGTKL